MRKLGGILFIAVLALTACGAPQTGPQTIQAETMPSATAEVTAAAETPADPRDLEAAAGVPENTAKETAFLLFVSSREDARGMTSHSVLAADVLAAGHAYCESGTPFAVYTAEAGQDFLGMNANAEFAATDTLC